VVTHLTATEVGSTFLPLTRSSGNPACSPPSPPPPDPLGWWAGLLPHERTRAYAGFQLWNNNNPACTDTRLDLYNGFLSYDLRPLTARSHPGAPIAARISRARLYLLVFGATESSSTICLHDTGGAGLLMLLSPSAPVTPGLQPGSLWPSGESLIDLAGRPVPWVFGRARASAFGVFAGQIVVEVEVTDLLAAALSRGDGRIGFAVASHWAQVPDGTELQIDCRTPIIPHAFVVESF
jgi:hypothetical protein